MTDCKSEGTSSTIGREQEAFEKQIDDLIAEGHEGEFVLFKDGHVQGFFGTEGEAFEAGMEKYGLDEEFIVDEIAKREPKVLSFAWEYGLSFGQ